jgi:hypothetical protein
METTNRFICVHTTQNRCGDIIPGFDLIAIKVV